MSELIPLERVLDDMSEDNGLVSAAARDYYRMHYATEKEAAAMLRHDRILFVLGLILVATVPTVIILSILGVM
jgi:hypothetical protein